LYKTYGLFGSDYVIMRCSNCKACFLSPKPDFNTLKMAYDPDYYGRKDEKFVRLVERLVDVFRIRRSYKVSKYLNDGANVLDIGCGNGRFLLLLLKFGKYNLYGTELEGNAAKRAMLNAEIKMKIGDIDDNDYEENMFDAITLYQVFEHLTRPADTLKQINRIIKPNGILAISFPNINSLQSKIFKGKWFHLDPPRHLFFFKPKDFIELMQDNGYVLIQEKYFSAEQNSYGWTQSLLNCLCKRRELLYECLKGNKEYAKGYSQFNITLQKLFFVITFPIFLLTDFIESLFKSGATVRFVFRKV